MKYKSVKKFLQANFFWIAIVISIFMVSSVFFYRSFVSKQQYVYTKIKLGQGFWWAATKNPNVWFIEALNNIKQYTSNKRNSSYEVISVRYYPLWDLQQFNIYITLKLNVKKLKNSNEYKFQRSKIAVGSPIDFNLGNIELSGTVINLSEAPITERRIEKTMVILKKNTYEWEYNQIEKEDLYFDGEEVVLKVIDKWKQKSTTIAKDSLENYIGINPKLIDIFVRLKIKLKKTNAGLVFGEEEIIKEGRIFNAALSKTILNKYIIVSLE